MLMGDVLAFARLAEAVTLIVRARMTVGAPWCSTAAL
jgi:hypothetical protein